MNIAIMQPYLFPHIGYFQLMHACDEFLVYDDVAFIPRGYINRNNVLLGGKAHRFTLSVPKASPNRLISELVFGPTPDSLLTTLHHAYARAPYYAQVMPLLQSVFQHEDRRIGALCKYSFERVCDYLGLECRFLLTSELEHDRSLKAQDRLIEMSLMRGAEGYINSIGGRKLYQAAPFAAKGITLSFLASQPSGYRQTPLDSRGEAGADMHRSGRQAQFVAGLSIIDMLMWCSPGEVRDRLAEYQLLPEDPQLLRATGNATDEVAPVAGPLARNVAAYLHQGGLASCH